ncbi:MAG TPA: DUF5666 domain-containing protein [Nitrospiraceae bacterium]|nr:DUF5666 domain-containing protein [Nitrospiraceae bacterium]
MKTFRLSMILGLGVLFMACPSCDPVPRAGGGIGGTGSVATVANGPVTQFGSVYISGTEYDNTNTVYCIDETPCSSQNTLKLGMVVLLNGRVTQDDSTNKPVTRIADKITYEETVEGLVQSVAADGLSLVVLGQVVHVDQKTNIDPSIPGQSLGNLRPGVDSVEVSGFVVGDGHILATLIMLQTGTLHYEIQGFIKKHDGMAKTFEIGPLVVEYSTADTSAMPSPASSTWNGLVVHVRGDQWTQGGPGPVGGRLTATRVKPTELGVEDIEEAEVEGFITHVVAPGDFFINNLHVMTSAATEFEGGTINDLLVDVHVEIEGRLANGVLQAEQVSFKGNFELESNVATVDPISQTLTLIGLSGMTVHITNDTALEGENDLRRFADIAVGDHLKIHGRSAGTNGLVATELERSGPSTGVKLQGPVKSVLEPTLVIAGAAIDTTGISDNGFTGSDGTVIGRSAFFQRVEIGYKVSLKGSWTGSGVNWTSARLK